MNELTIGSIVQLTEENRGLRYKQTPADCLHKMDDDAMHDCMGDFAPSFKTRSDILQALIDGDDAEIGRIVRAHCEEWAVSNLWEDK